MRNDPILNFAAAMLRIFNWLNWTLVIGMVAALLISFIYGDALATRLATKYDGRNVPETMMIIRGLLSLAVPAGFALHQIFTRLHAIVLTVRAGDPFVADNANRLQRIGWALLLLQILDLIMGTLSILLGQMDVDSAIWTPGFIGWIAVLMVFVLARIFRIGAAMRDDLALTV